MIHQKNNIFWFKLNGLMRYLLAHSASGYFPLYIVNEYPKSGGSWIGSMLGEALGVDFPRNRLPVLRSSILHGHMMHSWNMKNKLIVWRDGRDILISQYYYSLFVNDKGNDHLVSRCRGDLQFEDYNDIEKNLPKFIEYMYVAKRNPRISWADFGRKWAGCDSCVHVKYEDMRINPRTEMSRVIKKLSGKEISEKRLTDIVDKYSFQKQSGRQVGEENIKSFIIKGLVGDWKNYFDSNIANMFNEYAGDMLVKLGYEADKNWVSKIN